jgi:hypothetical protein
MPCRCYPYAAVPPQAHLDLQVQHFFGNRMTSVPRGTQVAALLSDGTEVECFVLVYACITLVYNLYVCILCIFSLRLHYRLLFGRSVAKLGL